VFVFVLVILHTTPLLPTFLVNFSILTHAIETVTTI